MDLKKYNKEYKKLEEEVRSLLLKPITQAQDVEIAGIRIEYTEKARELLMKYLKKELKVLKDSKLKLSK